MTPESPDPSEVLSQYTGHPVKLVMRPPNQSRPVDFGVTSKEVSYDGGVQASFADFGPFMLASSASLYDVQQRVEAARKNGDVKWNSSQPVTIDRWRPNIVFDGKLQNDCLCDRCVE